MAIATRGISTFAITPPRGTSSTIYVCTPNLAGSSKGLNAVAPSSSPHGGSAVIAAASRPKVGAEWSS
jgi:hypothetical protein